ncbi:MAG: CBS domain-containing protein [Gammaproteobacteria bacterium]|jgi:predicted transcriptional regulator|nr:CBS domain-containing protein [Gammaproteobacteria bacterium]
MKLERLATMTGFMRHGMTLRDFFQETVRCNVPGLPYVDEHDHIIGRISIRDVYKCIAVPDNILRIADAMGDGDQMGNLDMPEMKALEVMATPVENYLLEKIPTVSPSSTVVKALALMEVHNSSYIFLIEDGQYKGVVTRMIIAKRMLECVLEMERKKGISQ